MIPRKRIDIGWADLAYGIGACFVPGDREAAARRLERSWAGARAGLACLSVRSGLDALLGALAFARGDEIVVSAINIRDMARVIEAHGLVPVPVDLDMRQLALDPRALERAATPRARAVLVAHLYGARMPMEEIVRVARARGLLVIEDCAQAWTGDGWRGHPQSDVALFSFGPIKTATALAGGLLAFRDPGLRDRVRAYQERWPVHSRWRYLARLAKYAVFVLLGARAFFTLFTAACRVLGVSHERLLAGSVRGFAGGDFFRMIRQRPSFPLLALLARRIETYDRRLVERRIALARLARRLLPAVEVPGAQAAEHSYWVFPIRHRAADDLVRHLARRGFDATRGASSLAVIEPPPGREDPREAREVLDEVLYLPVYAGMTEKDVQRLAAAIAEFEGVPAVAPVKEELDALANRKS